MKHVTYAQKSLLLDDETAQTLVEYAALMAATSDGDVVSVRGIEPNGNEVEASLVLNSGTDLMAETTNSTMEPPANDIAIAYMRERIQLILDPPPATPEVIREEWD